MVVGVISSFISVVVEVVVVVVSIIADAIWTLSAESICVDVNNVPNESICVDSDNVLDGSICVGPIVSLLFVPPNKIV